MKVADFGIAKMAGQNTELTVAGSVMGSPQYLSPEQIRGEELDGRSDIFSLGVVLYELLSGRRPFDGETITTLVYQILHKDTPRSPSCAAVPPRLERAAARMLAKDRDERPGDAPARWPRSWRRSSASCPTRRSRPPAPRRPTCSAQVPTYALPPAGDRRRRDAAAVPPRRRGGGAAGAPAAAPAIAGRRAAGGRLPPARCRPPRRRARRGLLVAARSSWRCCVVAAGLRGRLVVERPSRSRQ